MYSPLKKRWTLIKKEGLVDYIMLDAIVEEIAGEGCMQVNKLIYAMQKEEIPEQVATYSHPERDYIYRELKSVMDVYESRVCSV